MTNQINSFLKKFENYNELLLEEINRIRVHKDKNIIDIYHYYFKTLIQINYHFNKNVNLERFHKKLILGEIHKINNTSKKIEKNLLQKNKTFSLKLEKVKILLLENKRNIKILENMLYSFKHFTYNPNYLKYKKISYKNLRFGDIILSLKNDDVINSSWIYKMIFINTKSHIGHVRMFYELKKGKPYFIDVPKMALNVKFRKTIKHYNKNVIGLVMRKKSILTKQEEIIMKEYIKKQVIGKRFALFKGAFLSIMFKSYDKFSFYQNLKNPFSPRWSVFCSENITRIYESIDIFIGDKDDDATITPVDLYNSSELDIVGYIDH